MGGSALSPLLDVQDIQLILSRHSQRIARSVWPIWDRYMAISEVDRIAYDAVAEANVLNRYMIDFAKREFAEVAGVQFFEDNGFVLGVDGFQYGMAGQLACRFKKLGDDGKSKNNMSTARARALRDNNNELLNGIPPEATWVDIGYVLNGLHTGIRDVQAIRLADTAFVMNFPEEADGSISMPLGLDLDPDGGKGGSRFIIVPRREGAGPGGDKPKDGK